MGTTSRFKYDESGYTFLPFVVSFVTLCFIPVTYYFWPREDTDRKVCGDCRCDPCSVKRGRLSSRYPFKRFRDTVTKVFIIVLWILIGIGIHHVSQLKEESEEFFPYEFLGISEGASVTEIRSAYKTLAKRLHPDNPETGDQTKFLRLRTAYEILTDDKARKNYELYGNVDGPVARTFGIALPSWIVGEENSTLVLGVYGLLFGVLLPCMVWLWWRKSMKFTSEEVLLETIHVYSSFLKRYPNMMVKKVLEALSCSKEFHPDYSKSLARPTDEKEVPELINSFSKTLKFKPGKYIFCVVKTHAILVAHLERIHLPNATLELDRLLIVAKCPNLIHEFITCFISLYQQLMFMKANERERTELAVVDETFGKIKRSTMKQTKKSQKRKSRRERLKEKSQTPDPPTLNTLESIMRLSPMIVQALPEKRSPLLQLPYMNESMLRHFVKKKVRSLKCLAQQRPNERQLLLEKAGLSSEEMVDVEGVLSRVPLVDMNVKLEVVAEEDRKDITKDCLVTVTVNLNRRAMRQLMLRSSFEENQPVQEDEVSMSTTLVEAGAEEEEKKTKKPIWQRNRGMSKKKKGNKKKGKLKRGKLEEVRTTVGTVTDQGNQQQTLESGDDDSGVESGEDVAVEDDAGERREGDDDEEWISDDLTDMMNKKRKEVLLKGVSRMSHPVHAPYFPEDKQEYWWLYILTRINPKKLITAPFHVTNLVEQEEVQLQFKAPSEPGEYSYVVVLRSDSYVGVSSAKRVRFFVRDPGGVPEEQNQWNISDDELDEEEYDEGDFATDDDDE
ncbi:unnamed protein product [Cyprideis torosa]|uniref:Uncharacterized protein n=1 Tax=Cyprideis torosa TaxID=163714 RepID=A0A7R8WGJ5_9CRUS|nr:unnamed protein product [Cyprideis torosa]CAG0898245.1 unnamed protein product [Cyprideis torosa]